MGLRKGISYQWKLFFPLVIGMWLALLTMGLWAFYTNRQSNIDRIQEQLDQINSRVINYYEGPMPLSGLRAYLTFIYNYYRDNPTFDAIRISVYKDGQLELSYGDPIILTPEEAAQTGGVTTESYGHNTNAFFSSSRDREYFYRIKRSADHRFAVYTFLPMDNQLEKSLDPGIRLFVALFILAVFLTLMAYLASRHFTRNIKLLRSVANQAVKADGFLPPEDFPHDELGDINRQIVTLFNARTQAMERQRREHAVALHAIEEKAKAKRQMSSNINHELRTPIGVIKGYLDTILENPDMDADTRNHFIRKALEHANRLVSQPDQRRLGNHTPRGRCGNDKYRGTRFPRHSVHSCQRHRRVRRAREYGIPLRRASGLQGKGQLQPAERNAHEPRAQCGGLFQGYRMRTALHRPGRNFL